MSLHVADGEAPQQDVRRVFRLARKLMPKDGDLEGWVRNLSAHRRRPIVLVEHELPETDGLSGMCIARENSDYIVLPTAASPLRRAVVIAHEVAHLLLDHQGAAVSSLFVGELTPDLSPDLVARVLRREGHSGADETAAEELATLLAAEHARRQRAAQLRTDPTTVRIR